MTGGIAYVLDESGEFSSMRCNCTEVDLEQLLPEDVEILKDLISRHCALTGSPRAHRVLDHWDALLPRFTKVFPREYKRVLGVVQDGGREARQVMHG